MAEAANRMGRATRGRGPRSTRTPKLVLSYFVGDQDDECAGWFIEDLKAQLAMPVQLTSDEHKEYLERFGLALDRISGSEEVGAFVGCAAEAVTPLPKVRRGSRSPR